MTLSDAFWDVLDAFGHSEKCSALRGCTHVRRDDFLSNPLQLRCLLRCIDCATCSGRGDLPRDKAEALGPVAPLPDRREKKVEEIRTAGLPGIQSFPRPQASTTERDRRR